MQFSEDVASVESPDVTPDDAPDATPDAAPDAAPDEAPVIVLVPEDEDKGIEIESSLDTENLDISVRSSYQDGWSCFATIGHFGTCRN